MKPSLARIHTVAQHTGINKFTSHSAAKNAIQNTKTRSRIRLVIEGFHKSRNATRGSPLLPTSTPNEYPSLIYSQNGTDALHPDIKRETLTPLPSKVKHACEKNPTLINQQSIQHICRDNWTQPRLDKSANSVEPEHLWINKSKI